MSRFFHTDCFTRSQKELRVLEATMHRIEMSDFLEGKAWKAGDMHADRLFELAKDFYGNEDKADDIRAELMEWRMAHKLDPLTGERQT